jgi:predicted RNase H-like HicB family nuclease
MVEREDDGSHVATIPEVGGLIAHGDTANEALKALTEIVVLALKVEA